MKKSALQAVRQSQRQSGFSCFAINLTLLTLLLISSEGQHCCIALIFSKPVIYSQSIFI